MRDSNGLSKYAVIASVLAFVLAAAAGVQGQKNSDRTRETFQNRQRAYNLYVLRNEIKSVEDAPMRCYLRSEVSGFLFANRVQGYLDTARDFAFECLEDTVVNAGQFTSAQSNQWRSSVVSMLRQHSPADAARAEAKYLSAHNAYLADLRDIDAGRNIAGVTNRVVGRILRGEVTEDVYPLFHRIRTKDPAAAARILDSMLVFFEDCDVWDRFGATLNFFSYWYLEPSAAPETRRRFLTFAVRLGQRALTAPETSTVFELSRYLLEQSIPQIAAVLPDLHQQAVLIYTTLDGKAGKVVRERNDLYERIGSAEDRLEATIAEAEAAENPGLRDELFQSAAKLALERREFSRAVDLILKIETDLPSFEGWRDHFLIDHVADSALKAGQPDAANYSVERVTDRAERGRGLLRIADGALNSGETGAATEFLDAALRVLETAPDTPAKVRVTLSALPLAEKTGKLRAFEIASAAFRTLNSLPQPDIGDRPETDARRRYVDSVLVPVAINIGNAFRILSRIDNPRAYAASQEIESRALRLAAQIIVETGRAYPLDADASE